MLGKIFTLFKGKPKIVQFVATFNVKKMDDTELSVEKKGFKIADRLNLNIVQRTTYKFEPQGRTSVFILSQSHLVIHTWPEHNFYHVDLLSCTNIKQKEFEKVIKDAFVKEKVKGLKVKKV